MRYVDWLLAGSCQQPVNTTHDYTNCCLYRVDTPDEGQQASSKQVEAYYWNKLIANSTSCWFKLYGCITMHAQQNIKNYCWVLKCMALYLYCPVHVRLLNQAQIQLHFYFIRNVTCFSVACVHYAYGFPRDATEPSGPGLPYQPGFTITLRHISLGKTPLNEWSARLRYLYLTAHDPHKKQTSIPPPGFEPTIPASERPQTSRRLGSTRNTYLLWTTDSYLTVT